MTARVLIVDDVLANVKLLQARLTAEYFDVVTATSGAEALAIAEMTMPDIVLLDVMMPEMDGFEVCRRLKADLRTQDIPVIMITSLDSPTDRVQGLEAGADDFLAKPVDDVALLARVRSLVRLKMITDELRSRTATGQRMGIVEPLKFEDVDVIQRARVLLVDDQPASSQRIGDIVGRLHDLVVEPDLGKAVGLASGGQFDLVVVSLNLAGADALRLCSHLRSIDLMRTVPILVLAEPDDSKRLARALDIGANDYLVRPIDRHELMARVRTQLRHRRYAEQLRADLERSVTMAVTDPLTGLHNRRFMESHLSTQIDHAIANGKPLSLILFDLDHFKAINDTHGHDAGDGILSEIGRIVLANVRGVDLGCRYGGEEFVVIMPGRDRETAFDIAERLRAVVADANFESPAGKAPLKVTISAGVATLEGPEDSPLHLLRRADKALYEAKDAGRNRVVEQAA
jgi:two-component system cell cycle response regulator